MIGRIEALLPYERPEVQALVWELKYYDSKIASSYAGAILAEHLRAVLAEEMLHKPLLIPIPLHEKRLRERGYNQCERIALQMLEHLKGQVVVAPKALARTRNTKRQTELTGAARKENVKDAFAVPNKELIQGKVCILIDDVVTTGATIMEARRALLEGGAAKVILIALAYA